MKAKKYFLVATLLFNTTSFVYAQHPVNIAAQKQDLSVSPRQSAEQKRLQKKLIKKIDDIYREIIAAYKAHRFEYAQERIVVFEALLDPYLLPEKYFEKMAAKMRSARKWMRDYYQKVQARERRVKQDKLFHQLQLSAQKKFLYDEIDSSKDNSEETSKAVSKTTSQKKIFKKITKLDASKVRKVAKTSSNNPKVVDVRPEVKPESLKESRPALNPKKMLQLKEDYKIAPGDARIQANEKTTSLDLEKKKEYIYKIHALYKDGLILFRKGLYNQSLKVLLEVDRAWPDYKLTRKYLKRLHAQLVEHEGARVEKLPSRQVVINKDLIIYQTLDNYTPKSKTHRKDL